MFQRSVRLSFLSLILLTVSPLPAQLRRSVEGLSSKPALVTAIASKERVRFAALALTQQMRLEVISQSGEVVYDSGFQPGNLLEWAVQEARLSDGLYGCLVTVEAVGGQVSHRWGTFRMEKGAATFQEQQGQVTEEGLMKESEEGLTILYAGDEAPFTLVLHDGKEGWIETGSGGLSLYAGGFSRERGSVPHLRVTPEAVTF